MTMTVDKMIAVLQAYKEGKVIQFSDGWSSWKTVVSSAFDFDHFIYRVKHEPREFTVLIDKDGGAQAVAAGDMKALWAPGATIKVREVLD